MVTLLPRCAGRHHHAKLWKDGEVSGDWSWRKLSLQTVVCNALWESRSPRTARQGINQAHARDQESVCVATRYHPPTLPSPPPVIDRCSLSIDWSFFSVISRLQSYHGLRGQCYCGPETAIIIVRYNNWTGAAPISHSSDLIYTMYQKLNCNLYLVNVNKTWESHAYVWCKSGHDQIRLTSSQGNFREFLVFKKKCLALLLLLNYCLTVACKKISQKKLQ